VSFILHRWKCLYPAYIDSSRTIAEGRRLSVQQGVEKPTAAEMGQALTDLISQMATDDDQALSFDGHIVQKSKVYPRDAACVLKGRVKVNLQPSAAQGSAGNSEHVFLVFVLLQSAYS
jgi:signal recognition particle subunit SEC65